MQLTHLVSSYEELDDDFLNSTRPAWSPSGLTTCLTQTYEGVSAYFCALTPAALSTLSLAHAYNVGANVLPTLIECMHATLSALNICAWRETTADVLANIVSAHKLAVRWNRAVDDFFIKEILDSCSKLEEIRYWGHVRLSPGGAFFFISDISQMSCFFVIC